MGPELAFGEALVRIGLSAVLAGAIGVERELRDHDAGLRTHMLVGLGATLFVIAGNFAWSELAFGNDVGIVLDPSRVVAYVVTGVGFLGAGAIIKHGASVRGLTTAASLWVVAAIGVVVGTGGYLLALVATATVLLSLWPLRRLAGVLGLRSRRTRQLVVDLPPGSTSAEILELVESRDAEVLALSVVADDAGTRLTLSISAREKNAVALLDQLSGSAAVRRVSLDA